MRSPRPGAAEYSLKGYGDMVADAVRMDAYRKALAASVKPGDVVLDLGAGTGIMSLLACQLGAARVYAIEPSDAIAVGVELARANGFADRIEFIQGSSLDEELARRAHVMVSDLRGILPLHALHIPSIVDARKRLLARGGIQIPQRDVLRAQLVADADVYAESTGPWSDPVFGLDLSPALRWATHQWHKADLSRAHPIAQPATVVELDYRTLSSPHMRGEVRWRVERDEVAHGLGLWFDTTLAKSIGFSNAPDQPRAIYGQAFFPFTNPVRIATGDSVQLSLSANLVGDGYVWRWHTSVLDGGGRKKLDLRQSSFQGVPVSPGRLRRLAKKKRT